MHISTISSAVRESISKGPARSELRLHLLTKSYMHIPCIYNWINSSRLWPTLIIIHLGYVVPLLGKGRPQKPPLHSVYGCGFPILGEVDLVITPSLFGPASRTTSTSCWLPITLILHTKLNLNCTAWDTYVPIQNIRTHSIKFPFISAFRLHKIIKAECLIFLFIWVKLSKSSTEKFYV